jgi:hypothetical protein
MCQAPAVIDRVFEPPEHSQHPESFDSFGTLLLFFTVDQL